MQKLMSKREAAGHVGIHPESLMRLVRQGQFPEPIKIGKGTNARVRFIADEVAAWVRQKMAERDAPASDAAASGSRAA